MRFWITILTLLMAISFTICACSHENEEPEIKDDAILDIDKDKEEDTTESQEAMNTDYAKCRDDTIEHP